VAEVVEKQANRDDVRRGVIERNVSVDKNRIKSVSRQLEGLGGLCSDPNTIYKFIAIMVKRLGLVEVNIRKLAIT
jgi:hypothetical protein